MQLTANRIVYNLVVFICFTALLTAEIIRCLSPMLAATRHKVACTTEWYRLPTGTSNWHTVELIGSLSVLLWQHSLRSWLPLATLFNLSPSLNLCRLESDPDQRFS